MNTRFLIIIGIAISGGVFGIAYGINQFEYHQDQKQYEEWRDIRESILSEIRENKIRNQTIPITDTTLMSDEEQCAWNFDTSMNEFVKEQEKYNDSPDANSKPLSEDQIVSTSTQFAKWRSVGCAFSIPEWAHLSSYEDWIWENIGPSFKIKGLVSYVKVNTPIFVSVEKIGYHMCDSWDAKIVSLEDNYTVWEKKNHSGCIVEESSMQKRFQYPISSEINPIMVSNIGNYTFQIDIGHVLLEKNFSVIEHEARVVYHDFDS